MVTHGSAMGGCSTCRGANAGEGLAFYSLAAKIVCCVYLALLYTGVLVPLQEGLTCRKHRASNFRVACGCHGNTNSTECGVI